MIGLLLVAVSLGASNIAASIGIGMAGVDSRTRFRVALVFGTFEAAMPVIGLALGRTATNHLGSAGHYVGAGLLVAVGAYTVVMGLDRDVPSKPGVMNTGHLVTTGLALSIDNLIVGFALSAFHVQFVVAALVIAAVSVGMSLVGLELGSRLGTNIERRSDVIGGLVLMAVGLALASGAFG